MFRKRTIVWIAMLVFILSSLLVGCSNNSGDTNGESKKRDNIEIRLAHDNSVDTPGHKAFLKFKELVETRSEGRIKVTIFPGGQLGTVQDTFEQARKGDIDMSVGATTLFTQTIPEFAVWDSFYLFDDVNHAHRVLDGKAGQELMKPLEKMNLTGLGYMEIGFRNFSNSKRPIETLSDLKGLKIRGYNPIQIKAWEAVGTSLTNLSWPEVFTSLQQNLIDGQESSTESFYSARFFEAQEYWFLTKHIYTNWLWYANKGFMDSLSAEDRQLIEEAAQEAIQTNRNLAREAEEEILAKLPELGVKVNEVSLETRNAMGELMNSAIKEDIVGRSGQALYDLVMEEVEKERR